MIFSRAPMPHHPLRIGRGKIVQIAVNRIGAGFIKPAGDLCQHPVVGEEIVGMQQPDDLAGGAGQRAVERIVDPAIALADQALAGIAHRFEQFRSPIGGSAILHDMLEIGEALRVEAGQRIAHRFGAVAHYCQDREGRRARGHHSARLENSAVNDWISVKYQNFIAA